MKKIFKVLLMVLMIVGMVTISSCADPSSSGNTDSPETVDNPKPVDTGTEETKVYEHEWDVVNVVNCEITVAEMKVARDSGFPNCMSLYNEGNEGYGRRDWRYSYQVYKCKYCEKTFDDKWDSVYNQVVTMIKYNHSDITLTEDQLKIVQLDATDTANYACTVTDETTGESKVEKWDVEVEKASKDCIEH